MAEQIATPSVDINKLEDQLILRKQLQDITNRINAAQNIRQILVDLKDGILALFSAHAVTIYVVDKVKKNEIYSMFLAGSQIREIRVPISNRSIAGYVANTGNSVNIADAYDTNTLKSIHKDLTFDVSWDKKTGFKSRQILAAPIFYNKSLMGVIQILNRKPGVRVASLMTKWGSSRRLRMSWGLLSITRNGSPGEERQNSIILSHKGGSRKLIWTAHGRNRENKRKRWKPS